MWIYTSKAMVSIVQHNAKPNHVLVRARKQDHIVHFLATIPGLDYFYLEQGDYQWRALINKIDLDRLVMHHLTEIEYFDFKGSIPKTDPDYYKACFAGWQAMNDFGKGTSLSDEPEHEWIPCDHQMPEEKGKYLTRWDDGVIETYQFDNENDNHDGWYSKMGGSKITHWMEVPRFMEG
jgi:hypothetical protein